MVVLPMSKRLLMRIGMVQVFSPRFQEVTFFFPLARQKHDEDVATLQSRFTDVDVRLVDADRTLTIGTDNDTAQGFIFGSSPSESEPVDNYWNDNVFQPELADAEFLSKAAGATIEDARLEEAALQRRFFECGYSSFACKRHYYAVGE